MSRTPRELGAFRELTPGRRAVRRADDGRLRSQITHLETTIGHLEETIADLRELILN
jgi:hypothetical protein